MSVQAEAEQAVHVVEATEIALQSKDDSQPLVGRESLSNLLLVHVESAVQTEDDEQEVHVVAATDGHPASHPSFTIPLSLKKLLRQEIAVQVERSEQSVQVAPATGMLIAQ